MKKAILEYFSSRSFTNILLFNILVSSFFIQNCLIKIYVGQIPYWKHERDKDEVVRILKQIKSDVWSIDLKTD